LAEDDLLGTGYYLGRLGGGGLLVDKSASDRQVVHAESFYVVEVEGTSASIQSVSANSSAKARASQLKMWYCSGW
jgi:hypothetical protein